MVAVETLFRGLVVLAYICDPKLVAEEVAALGAEGRDKNLFRLFQNQTPATIIIAITKNSRTFLAIEL